MSDTKIVKPRRTTSKALKIFSVLFFLMAVISLFSAIGFTFYAMAQSRGGIDMKTLGLGSFGYIFMGLPYALFFTFFGFASRALAILLDRQS